MKITEWGPETWMLLHTIAEKIYDDKFISSKNEIFQIISLIASSVPCPFCREHATQYLKQHKIHLCNNKHDLKMYLLNFHNNVNVKLKKPVFSYASLSKYSQVNFSQLVKRYSFNNSKNRSTDLSFSFHRNNNIKLIVKLFIKNTLAFAP
tara:strand:- start:8958 stop:9407 length:450 start_codon:yes stop_codon:yes gene_type:complete